MGGRISGERNISIVTDGKTARSIDSATGGGEGNFGKVAVYGVFCEGYISIIADVKTARSIDSAATGVLAGGG